MWLTFLLCARHGPGSLRVVLSLFQMSGILELPVLFQKTAHLPVLTTTAPQSWCLGPVTSGQENSLHGTSDLQKGAFRARSREDTASPPPMSSEATQPRFHHIPPTKAITEAHPASRRGDRRLWLWGGQWRSSVRTRGMRYIAAAVRRM